MTSAWDSVTESLECGICFEPFNDDDNIPTTLPCGHSLCIKHAPHLSCCHICRARIPEVRSLSKSVTLAQVGAAVQRLLQEPISQSVRMDPPLSRSSHYESDLAMAMALQAELNREAAPPPTPPAPPAPPAPPPRPDTPAPPAPPPILRRNLSNQRRNTNNRTKACGHNGCEMNLNNCCACSDLRPRSASYPNYIDGVGWATTPNRTIGYCQHCRR